MSVYTARYTCVYLRTCTGLYSRSVIIFVPQSEFRTQTVGEYLGRSSSRTSDLRTGSIRYERACIMIDCSVLRCSPERRRTSVDRDPACRVLNAPTRIHRSVTRVAYELMAIVRYCARSTVSDCTARTGKTQDRSLPLTVDGQSTYVRLLLSRESACSVLCTLLTYTGQEHAP